MKVKSTKILYGRTTSGHSVNPFCSTVSKENRNKYIDENTDGRIDSVSTAKAWNRCARDFRFILGLHRQVECPWCQNFPISRKVINTPNAEFPNMTRCKECDKLYFINYKYSLIGDIVGKFLNYKPFKI